jgi:integrase
LVVPSIREGAASPPDQWSANGFNQWRSRVFQPAVQAVSLDLTRPYDLRHAFASLLAHEGRSVVYIAQQLGHGPELSLKTYQHVIDELEGAPRLAAEVAIRQAREQRQPLRKV